MKRMLLLLAVAAATMATGCASTGSSLAAAGHAKHVDTAYVARVETIARRRGVKVAWVNPPQVETPVVAQQH